MTAIYATATVPAIGQQAFAHLGPIQVLSPDWSDLDRAEVLLVRAEVLDAAAIERAGSLRLIARTGSGVDKVDVDAARARQIPVIYAPGAGSRPVAEGTIALIIAAMKRVGELGAVLREGRWQERYAVEILDLKGAVLGIVGYGRIGSEVAGLARGLGMEVIAHDPHRGTGDDSVRFVGLRGLLASSDVVSLHCPLTPETRGLIDREALAAVKPGAVLVNVARGEIIAGEEILLEALCDGRLSALALDVFASEPPAAESELLANARVICSPHSIGLTRTWNQRVFAALARDVELFLAGKEPEHVVGGSWGSAIGPTSG